jgi:hypothetical protein
MLKTYGSGKWDDLQCSNSAHEPQKVVIDYQALTHFEVHGRNARKEVSGKSHYGPVTPRRVSAHLNSCRATKSAAVACAAK